MAKVWKYAQGALPALIGILGDDTDIKNKQTGASFSPSSEANKTLFKIGLPSVAPLLLALSNTDPKIRAAAAHTLGDMSNVIKENRTPGIIEQLTKLLKDKDSDVRGSAAYALGWLSSAVESKDYNHVVDTLIIALEIEDKAPPQNGYGHRATSQIVGALKDFTTQECGGSSDPANWRTCWNNNRKKKSKS